MLSDEAVKKFVGERKAKYPLLDVDNPVSYGSFTMSEYYFEIKRNQMEGMNRAPEVYKSLSKELAQYTGREYPMIDAYRAEDADYLIVIMSSATGVVKDVVDEMREKGVKAGCLGVRFFRPFPFEEIRKLAKGKKGIAVLDRSAALAALPRWQPRSSRPSTGWTKGCRSRVYLRARRQGSLPQGCRKCLLKAYGQ